MIKKYSDIESFYLDLQPWQQKQFEQVRRLILDAVQEVEESLKYNVPFYTYKGLLFYFALYKSKYFVLGFCEGFMLNDEAGVLKADSGQTQVRHWVFEEGKTVDEKLLLQYIHEAVLINDLLKEKKKVKKNNLTPLKNNAHKKSKSQ